jgi:polyferredoxin
MAISVLLVLGIVLVAIAFVIGTAMTFARSPNRDPLAALNSTGIETQAVVQAIEDDGDEPNILVQYQVDEKVYTRSIPWPPNKARPTIGENVTIRYLPKQPGLSRLV